MTTIIDRQTAMLKFLARSFSAYERESDGVMGSNWVAFYGQPFGPEP